MPRKREINLTEYHISKNRYWELLYFCRGYQDRKTELSRLYSPPGSILDGMPKAKYSYGDPTATRAIRAAKLRSENEMIEQAAIAADPYIYPDIIKNVTQGIGYDRLGCPCSKGYFYSRRKKFFKILNGMR